MKKTDIAMIIFIASVGVIIAYFIASSIPFLKLPEDGVKVQTIREINSHIEQPDAKIFNSEAINPTVEVIVGHNAAE